MTEEVESLVEAVSPQTIHSQNGRKQLLPNISPLWPAPAKNHSPDTLQAEATQTLLLLALTLS
jgi:hypothetical protein